LMNLRRFAYLRAPVAITPLRRPENAAAGTAHSVNIPSNLEFHPYTIWDNGADPIEFQIIQGSAFTFLKAV